MYGVEELLNVRSHCAIVLRRSPFPENGCGADCGDPDRFPQARLDAGPLVRCLSRRLAPPHFSPLFPFGQPPLPEMHLAQAVLGFWMLLVRRKVEPVQCLLEVSGKS